MAAFCGGWGEDSIAAQNTDYQDVDAWTLMMMLIIYRHCTPYAEKIQWQGSTLLRESSPHAAELRQALHGNNLSNLFWPTGDEVVSDFERQVRLNVADYPSLGFAGFLKSDEVKQFSLRVDQLHDPASELPIDLAKSIYRQAVDTQSGLFFLCSG